LATIVHRLNLSICVGYVRRACLLIFNISIIILFNAEFNVSRHELD